MGGIEPPTLGLVAAALPSELHNDCQSGLARTNDPIIKSDVLYQLSYRLKYAANGVTHFFYRGHTSRLKFVFSLQLFFTAFAFSIGGFIPPRTLPTSHL